MDISIEQALVFVSDFFLGVVSPASPAPPADTSESGDADDEAGADDGKDVVNDKTTPQDDEAENVAQENLRKRPKVNKNPMSKNNSSLQRKR